MANIYLFVDTNVFIQCLPLEQINWSAWSTFDEVHVIVCRPVQREIDKQKNRGNDRIGKRSRQAASMFKDIIIADNGYKLVHEAAPPVKLRVEPSYMASAELRDRLDYSKVDDEIVGCLHAYREAHPHDDARLLTHDSGPMATAKMLSLPFEAVPDSWLVQPESNEAERNKRRLESELARLRKAEPEFKIFCLDHNFIEVESLEFEHRLYNPLTEDEVVDLIAQIKEEFPITTAFGPRERIERDVTSTISIPGMKEVFVPASDEEIVMYTDESYPNWIQQCDKLLRDLHNLMQHEAGPPTFRFAAINSGSRPGKDVLVTLTAKGDFEVCAPEPRNDGDADKETQGTRARRRIGLPVPPKPPLGEWITSFGGCIAPRVDPHDYLKGVQQAVDPHGILRGSDYRSGLVLPKVPSFRRDPNSFYYKPERPTIPVSSFSFECEQWRHNLQPEMFSGEIYFSNETNVVQGALECTIHAENLSDPLKITIKVIIEVSSVNLRQRAINLVRELHDYQS